jgi:DNA polymerase-3 subunit beta
MKITVIQKNFKQGVFVTSSITGKNTNLPILNNLMISAQNGLIKLMATDLEIGISAQIRGKIEEEGLITLDAKLLSNYINLLANKKIDFSTVDNNITFDCENYKTKIKGESADDYPLIPELDKNNYYCVKISDLKKAIASVVFSVMFNENRLALSGVLFDFSDNKLTLAGTDSYRLAERVIDITVNITEEEKNKKVIVPIKTLQELLRIISGDYSDNKEVDELRVSLNDNQIAFSFDVVEIVSRLIDEQYPDYHQIVPSEFKTKCIVDRHEFIRAVKAGALFSKTGINDVNLDFSAEKNSLVISAASGQSGENIVTLEAKVEGVDNNTILNFKYLIDGLNNIDSDLVRLELIDGVAPCMLRPLEDDSYYYIIMPIKK